MKIAVEHGLGLDLDDPEPEMDSGVELDDEERCALKRRAGKSSSEESSDENDADNASGAGGGRVENGEDDSFDETGPSTTTVAIPTPNEVAFNGGIAERTRGKRQRATTPAEEPTERPAPAPVKPVGKGRGRPKGMQKEKKPITPIWKDGLWRVGRKKSLPDESKEQFIERMSAHFKNLGANGGKNKRLAEDKENDGGEEGSGSKKKKN